MADLDTLVQRARDATVRRDVADAYVRELARWAEPPRRLWLPWLAFGITAAVAAALAIALWPRDSQTIQIAVQPGHVERARDVPAAPITIGDRVAIVVEPGTSFRVLRATADETRIEVERGAVTARLFHGDGTPVRSGAGATVPGATGPGSTGSGSTGLGATGSGATVGGSSVAGSSNKGSAHRLTLEGGGVVATATGTVFSLAVGPNGAAVHVDDGAVSVRDAAGPHVVSTGTSWPASGAGSGATPPSRRAADALLALAAPPPIPGAATPPRAPNPLADHDTPTPESAKDRWRRARLFRGQGKFAEAIAECIAIADSRDATWAPIALLEAARIYVGPLNDPEHAIAIADRMIAAWPTAALVAETREIRCRALGQLGRGAECAPPHP